MKVWIQISTWEGTGKGMVIYDKFSSKLIFEDFWKIFLKKVTEDQLQTRGQIEQSNGLFIDLLVNLEIKIWCMLWYIYNHSQTIWDKP